MSCLTCLAHIPSLLIRLKSQSIRQLTNRAVWTPELAFSPGYAVVTWVCLNGSHEACVSTVFLPHADWFKEDFHLTNASLPFRSTSSALEPLGPGVPTLGVWGTAGVLLEGEGPSQLCRCFCAQDGDLPA